mmetsp:Transcript_55325/g.134369  ORF Transcript_55325/g.134369 Transcript_55325/m.134369 type:complete len:435 (+) Transcript_55325:129-1433(+)
MLGSFIKSLFLDKAIVDDREPIFTFHLGGHGGKDNGGDDDDTTITQFGLFLPRKSPWIQLAVFVLIQSIVQQLFAVVIYFGIVRNRGTVQSYLLGWGFIIPISIYMPFLFLDYFDIRNKVLALSASTIMTVIGFRCVEAMYGATLTLNNSEVIESTVGTYCAYYSSVAPFVWTSKGRQRITFRRLVSIIVELGLYFIAVSAVLSMMIHFRYKPFVGDEVGLTSLTFNTSNFSLPHLGNSYCQAILVYLTLKTGFELTALAENIKGYETDTIFDSPFTKSTSPTDFWTRRWNLMIQRILKGGVFLPIKKHRNAKVAMFMTFVVSGLYHEYVWECIFYNQNYVHDSHGNCYEPGCYANEFGRVTAFFTYVGLIMLLERPVGKLPPVRWLAKSCPAPVVAHSLILLHLPVGQWYIGDWLEGGYFDDFSICTLLIRKM